MKKEKFDPYTIDDTFTLSKEVLSMSPKQRRAEIKKYEALIQKNRDTRQRTSEKQFA